MTANQNLHRQLVQLRQTAADWVGGRTAKKFLPYEGICGNLRPDATGRNALGALMARWPGGSCRGRYPVPLPGVAPLTAFLRASPDEMWNPEHEYARNRLALLDWLIEQTSNE